MATPTVHLVASLSYQGTAAYGGVIRTLIEGYIADHFSAKHPGVRVTTVAGPRSTASSTGAPPTAASMTAAVLTGQGPDVLSGTGYSLPAFMDAHLLVPLDSYVAKAGVDLTAFDPGHLEILRQAPTGLLALPAFDGPAVVLVNLTAIDAAGLAEPGPDWTAATAVQLWNHLAGLRKGQRHWGMSFDLQEYFLYLFGGRLMNADGTRCLLNDPKVVEAADWIIPLYQNGVADVTALGAGQDVRTGAAACGMTAGHSLQGDTLAMHGMGVRWDFLPMPLFPGGRRYTYNNGDWYGINALSKAPHELLWALLDFVALDPGFARLLFQTTLVPPNRRNLWDSWMTTVRGVAPMLASKHLEYFVQAMDYGVCNHRFRLKPYECDTILQQWIIRMFLGTVSPNGALQQATQAINALQQG